MVADLFKFITFLSFLTNNHKFKEPSKKVRSPDFSRDLLNT